MTIKNAKEVAAHFISRATKKETTRQRNFDISSDALTSAILREAHRIANVRRCNLEDSGRVSEAAFYFEVEEILIDKNETHSQAHVFLQGIN